MEIEKLQREKRLVQIRLIYVTVQDGSKVIQRKHFFHTNMDVLRGLRQPFRQTAQQRREMCTEHGAPRRSKRWLTLIRKIFVNFVTNKGICNVCQCPFYYAVY